jgi:hypothetical protein
MAINDRIENWQLPSRWLNMADRIYLFFPTLGASTSAGKLPNIFRRIADLLTPDKGEFITIAEGPPEAIGNSMQLLEQAGLVPTIEVSSLSEIEGRFPVIAHSETFQMFMAQRESSRKLQQAMPNIRVYYDESLVVIRAHKPLARFSPGAPVTEADLPPGTYLKLYILDAALHGPFESLAMKLALDFVVSRHTAKPESWDELLAEAVCQAIGFIPTAPKDQASQPVSELLSVLNQIVATASDVHASIDLLTQRAIDVWRASQGDRKLLDGAA